MSNVVRMSATKQAGQGPNLNSGADDNDASHGNFSYRLFIIVDEPTFTVMEWLRASLEAPSFGDVVRQAVRAFALRFMQDEKEAMFECGQVEDAPSRSQQLKRLNIRIPAQTKDRLDMLKKRSGLSYTAIIGCGVMILADRAKDEEQLLSLLRDTSKDEDINGDGDHCTMRNDEERRSSQRHEGNDNTCSDETSSRRPDLVLC